MKWLLQLLVALAWLAVDPILCVFRGFGEKFTFQLFKCEMEIGE